MTTDNWQQFKLVFQSALDLPQDQRSAYLDRVCTDPSLRAEVESLLLCYHGGSDGSKEIGVRAPVVNALSENQTTAERTDNGLLVESFIDHYQIVKKVGKSERATQYLALRLDDPGLQQVIILVIKTETSAEEILRSEKDRATLMNLHHPNIVSFVGTGNAPGGLGYLATEYVEGVPIEEYCDLNKLNTHARLKLFIDVCDAVQYAHRHFIAHGGINSRRVLVSKNGKAKLLDLGLVDWLSRQSPSLTSLGGEITRRDMEYLSPEQIQGRPLTTADDVYSLGILLYRLLTGHSPYRMKDGKEDDLLPAIFEAIKPSNALNQNAEQTGDDGKRIVVSPEQLSMRRNEKVRTTRRLLAGDLDSIVLKAIRKDSAKRYSSVEQFSGDLRCYLRGRPVSTRKATLLYRAGKFLGRHKTSR